MSIQRVAKISCSLALGLLYNLDYSYDPENGVKITAFFVNESGSYSTNFLNAKTPCSITIGSASFQVYPISWEKVADNSKRVLKVEFWDSTFQLENYFIVLKGRGCGTNIFSLGDEDPLTYPPGLSGVEKSLIDKTKFANITYSFQDFLSVLNRVFSVSNQANLAGLSTLKSDFTGSFRSVLNAWCSFLGLNYFFSNNRLYIINPASFPINFPSPPNDAIGIRESESLQGSFSKTGCLYTQLEGAELDIQTTIAPAGDSGTGSGLRGEGNENPTGIGKTIDTSVKPVGELNTLITSLTFEPIFPGYIPDSEGNPTDFPEMEQVIAAMYGQKFWFLFNYFNQKNIELVDPTGNFEGFSDKIQYFTKIGFYRISVTKAGALLNANAIAAIQGSWGDYLGYIDEAVFSANYAKYREYGEKICGRIYQTWIVNDLDYYKTFTFIRPARLNDETSVSFEDIQINFEEFSSPQTNDREFGLIPGTATSNFPGLLTNGKRFIYVDNKEGNYDELFSLEQAQIDYIETMYKKISEGIQNSSNLQISTLSWFTFPMIESESIPSFFTEIVEGDLGDRKLWPRFPNAISFKGVKRANIIREKDENVGESIRQITGYNTLPNVILPSGPVKPDGSYDTNISTPTFDREPSSFSTIYPKYEKCVSSSRGIGQNVLNHRFSIKRIDPSNFFEDIDIRLIGNKEGQAEINRKTIAEVNKIMSSQLLDAISNPKTIIYKELSFQTNYFYNFGSNPVSDGLSQASVSITENGVSASYTYSNAILFKDFEESEVERIERSIKNSYIQKRFSIQRVEA